MAWAETERLALAATLRETDPEAPTLCRGWRARHLLAHLVQREQKPVAGAGDVLVRREPGQERFLGRLADSARSRPGYEALIDRFVAGPPRWSPMAWASESINLVEYVIHHEDVRRGATMAEPRVLPEAEARAVWTRLGMFGRLSLRSSPVGVSLALPDGERQQVRKGDDGVVLTGEPVELALYVSGRRGAAAVEVLGEPATVETFRAWVADR